MLNMLVIAISSLEVKLRIYNFYREKGSDQLIVYREIDM